MGHMAEQSSDLLGEGFDVEERVGLAGTGNEMEPEDELGKQQLQFQWMVARRTPRVEGNEPRREVTERTGKMPRTSTARTSSYDGASGTESSQGIESEVDWGTGSDSGDG